MFVPALKALKSTPTKIEIHVGKTGKLNCPPATLILTVTRTKFNDYVANLVKPLIRLTRPCQQWGILNFLYEPQIASITRRSEQSSV